MHKRISIIAAILALMAGHQALACTPAPPRESYTTSKESIELKIGDVYFRFPASFFFAPDDRMPIERDYVHIRVFMPDFKPPAEPPPRAYDKREAWNKEHPSMTIMLKEAGVEPKGLGYATNAQYYPLDGHVEMRYMGGTLTPEGVSQKLKPYMYSKPSADWQKNQALAKALEVDKEHIFSNPCAMFSMNANAKPEPKPEPPPLVPMDVIEQGLTSKYQAIRVRAVRQLGRYDLSEQVEQRLYKMASTDKEVDVRLAAISVMRPYNPPGRVPAIDVMPLYIELFKHERDDEVIDALGQQLSRDPQSAAPALVDDMPKAKGQRLYKEAETMAWAVNREAQGKLTDYSQLSPQTKKYLDAVMDFYERPDVDDRQKGQISNILRNSKTAIATPRYVTLLMKRNAVAELGDLAYDPDKVIPFLIAELKSPRYGNYSGAIEALGRFGPAAKSALPTLIPFLHFTCPGTNPNAAAPLPSITWDPTICQPAMNTYIQQMTANVIGDIGVSTPEVLQALYDDLNTKENVSNAEMALAKLEPDPTKLLQKLMTMMKTAERTERGRYISVLGIMGPKAQDAVPELKRMAADSENKFLQGDIAKAIEKISGEKIMPANDKQGAVKPPPPLPVAAPSMPPAPTTSTKGIEPIVPPPLPIAVVAPVAKADATTVPQFSDKGPLDISVESHDAYEKHFANKTNRKNGELARYGAWDNGDCHGGDAWMCGGMTGNQTGCEQPFKACASDVAVATESYAGDGKCVRTWWKWVCK